MREYPLKDCFEQPLEAGDLVAFAVKNELTVGKIEYKYFVEFVDSDGKTRQAKTFDVTEATHCTVTARRIFNYGYINIKHRETGQITWGEASMQKFDPDRTKWQAERATPLTYSAPTLMKVGDDLKALLAGKAAV